MTITLRLIAALTVCFSLLGANLNAQSAWLPPTDGSSISVETYRLDRTSWSTSANGSVMFLTARLQPRSGLTLVFELPLARSDETLIPNLSQSFTQKSQTAIGNPYFGFSFTGNQPSFTTFDIGVRFPLTPDSKFRARNTGSMIDFDRWESFARDLYLVRMHVGHRWSKPFHPISDWINGGITLLSSGENSEVELIIDYQAGIRYKLGQFAFSSTFIGRTLLTSTNTTQIVPTDRSTATTAKTFGGETVVDDDGFSFSFKERSEFLLGIGANLTLGSLRPGVSARFPLLDGGLFQLDSRVNAIYGANLTLLFGGKE